MDSKRIALVAGAAAVFSLTFTGIALATPGPDTAACAQATQLVSTDAGLANAADVKVKADRVALLKAQAQLDVATAALPALQKAYDTALPADKAAALLVLTKGKHAVSEATIVRDAAQSQLNLDVAAAAKAHAVLDKAIAARDLACNPPVTPVPTVQPTTVAPVPVVVQPVVVNPQFVTVPNVSAGVDTGDGSLA